MTSLNKNLNIDISIDDDRWKSSEYNDLENKIKHTLENAFLNAPSLNNVPDKDCEISISLSNDDHVKELNAQYRAKDKPTNILSFPSLESENGQIVDIPEELLMDDNFHLGDLILAYDTIEKEADEQNKAFTDHVTHLILHGYLHVIGYTHEHDDDAKQMENLEIQILNNFGIKNPYQHI